MTSPANIPQDEWRGREAWILANAEAARRRTFRRGFFLGLICGVVAAEILTGLRGCTIAPYPTAYMPSEPIDFIVLPTGSMRPTFNDGDIARILPGKWSDVKVGKVVIRGNANWSKFGRVFHRVVAVEPRGFITRGDNCQWDDAGFMIEQDFGGFVELVSRNPAPKPHRVGFGLKQ